MAILLAVIPFIVIQSPALSERWWEERRVEKQVFDCETSFWGLNALPSGT